MVDRVGQQLGNYRLVRLLGRGGFAEVYLGEHVRLGIHAAVKVLYSHLANNDDVENFQKEARIIAHLEHPNIVRVFDFDVSDDTPFLVMNYAPNGTLRQRYPKGTTLPLPVIINYVKQAADALQYAHDQHLIHRDVKPENMLLSQRDDLLLSDFGIAILSQSSRYQSTQNMVGTMAYMAPEQIQGKPRPASDQYSLGIVVYEWLSGDRPFHGSLKEVIAQHLASPPLSLREKMQTLSPAVERVVMTALAKEPKERFRSVREFALALEQASQTPLPPQFASPKDALYPDAPSLPKVVAPIVPTELPQPINTGSPPGRFLQPNITGKPSYTSDTPHTVSPPTIGPVSSDWSQQPQRRISRRAVVAGLAGVSVVGGSLAWLTHSLNSQGPTASLHNATSPTASKSSTAISPTASSTRLAASPLGTTFFVCQGHTGAVYAAQYSFDGRYIASGSYDRTVRIWNAQNGNHIYTYKGHSDGVWTLAWSPNSMRIASGSATINYGGDPTVQVWNATDGSNAFIYHGHTGAVRAIAWSPDGNNIASGGDDSTVQVWNALNGNLIYTYRRFSRPIYAIAWSPNGNYLVAEGGDATIQVWNAANGNYLYTYHGHANAGYVNYGALSWSPDSTRIVSCAGPNDFTAQVWQSSDGTQLYTYRGHSNNVCTVAWSPDGSRIASGSGFFVGNPDNTAQVWSASNGNHLYTYHGQTAWVHTVAWSHDGSRIASGGEDLTVRVWQAI